MAEAQLKNAFIVDGLRTPFGRYGGALSDLRPDDVAAAVLAGLQEKLGVSGDAVEEVILGCSNQGGEDSRNLASGVNDANAAGCERLGRKPLARVLSCAAVGVPALVMGIGPVTAIRKALSRAGLTLDEMDVIEINEAFAAQVLGCLKELGLPYDDKRVNGNGRAIAVGHPLGASGARLALTAARALAEQGGKYAVVSLCVGIGQGEAMVIEAVS